MASAQSITKNNNTGMSVITAQKAGGQYYTPDYLVKNILDLAGYFGHTVLKKHIIDNSCGDGAFLVEMVERYCRAYQKSKDTLSLAKHLSEFIHGIEIEKNEYMKCITRLNEIAANYNAVNVRWDIHCADALEDDRYNGRMDFVVGNPPYVRVHHLNDTYGQIKKFNFTQSGMTDLFIVFYEIGLKMLAPGGVLAYITPSSLFNSVAGNAARENFIRTKSLKTVIDLKHYQPFGAITYTAIVVLKNGKTDCSVQYGDYDEQQRCPRILGTLDFNDLYIVGKYYFGPKKSLDELREILFYRPRVPQFQVKNGFATLCDNFFIGRFDFEDFCIPILKASTEKMYQCLFPYRNGRLVPYDEIGRCQRLNEYFQQNREVLESRSIEDSEKWYGFGRSQGINDVYKDKIAVNALIRDLDSIKIRLCEAGTGVYSGLYILTDIPYQEVRQLLVSDDFLNYLVLLSKYKSGGYYTFSSKDLQMYLEYKFKDWNPCHVRQRSLFEDA